MIKLLRPFQLCVIDEFAADLDIFSRTRFFEYLGRECDKYGSAVIYATHIFDGLDDWPTHLHYLCNKGCTGWQGKIGDLEIYQEMRRKGEPSPLLRIAETWLRGELEQNNIVEAPAGKMAIEAQNPLANGYGSAGGFSAGRMGAYDYIG